MPSLIHKDVLAFVLLVFIALPISIYSAYSNVFAKNIQDNEEVETYTENLNEDDALSETMIGEENIQQLEQAIIETQIFTDIQLVSRYIDWSLVNSCISSETKCICYGHAIERYGWPGKKRELVSEPIVFL